MPTYSELRSALEVLGLGERASLTQIKERHRTLVHRHHPDAGGEDDDAIRRINAAYRVVAEYCRDYRFDFSREEFLEQCPEERLRDQFAGDPVWEGRSEE